MVMDLDPSVRLPDATLITGPVGCGKTEAALEAVLRVRQFGSAFSTIWVLLATGLQRNAFRARLLARSPDAVQFGVELFDFYAFYRRLLDVAGDPQRHLAEPARYHVLRHIIGELNARGELELYGRIAHLPGFVAQVGALISELKQALVFPQDFAAVADERGPRDRDLARIYTAYQDFLHTRRLVDRHGAGWLALEHVEANPTLAAHVDLLVVDGFDQFNAVHVRLVSALARQVRRAVLTLTDAPDEPGRHFHRIQQTTARMLAAAPDLWRRERLDGCSPGRDPALEHLTGALFTLRPERMPGGAAVRLIEAPDPVREVEQVLRRVKRLLLDGAPPDEIAIAARTLDRYGGTLRETARAYGIPLVVREATPLRENPAVAAVLELIDLHAADFPRRGVIDCLRSPYLRAPDLSPDQIAMAERISLRRQVVRGRAIWLDAIHAAVGAALDEDREEHEPLDEAQAAALADALARTFDRITPPGAGTAYELAGWIMGLIGPDPAADDEARAEGEDVDADEPAPAPGEHFDVLACVRASEDAGRVARDVAALGALRDMLVGICAAHELVAGEGALPVLAWHEFRSELDLALEGATVVPPGGLSRRGRVLATDVLELRGLPHTHVFVLGLAEGEFPAPVTDGALYQERERAELAECGVVLPSLMERADDMSLFYQAVGQARGTLTLSRPTVDDKGAPLEPSPYWRAVRAVIDVPPEAIERLAPGAAPTLADAATEGEAAVAVAAAFNDGGDDARLARAVYNALLDVPAWHNALRGRAVEVAREDGAHPFDPYTGALGREALRATVEGMLGPRRVWSASQLNEYGQCPFKFFARRLLRLEELKEPEEGLDALQRGLVNHAILELAYRWIAEEGLAIVPENAGRALELLDAAALEVFRTAPRDYGFRAGPVWAQEREDLLRRLRALVALDFSEASPLAKLADGETRSAYALELRFGPEAGVPVTLDGEAGRLRVRGTIDRLDIAGDRVIVVDYKTGSSRRTEHDIRAGREVQVVLYLHAAHTLLRAAGEPVEVAGGAYWHIQNLEVSGQVSAGDGLLAEATAQIHAHVGAARAGRFPVLPSAGSTGCMQTCEYARLCRLTRGYLRKPGAWPAVD